MIIQILILISNPVRFSQLGICGSRMIHHKKCLNASWVKMILCAERVISRLLKTNAKSDNYKVILCAGCVIVRLLAMQIASPWNEGKVGNPHILNPAERVLFDLCSYALSYSSIVPNRAKLYGVFGPKDLGLPVKSFQDQAGEILWSLLCVKNNGWWDFLVSRDCQQSAKAG